MRHNFGLLRVNETCAEDERLDLPVFDSHIGISRGGTDNGNFIVCGNLRFGNDVCGDGGSDNRDNFVVGNEFSRGVDGFGGFGFGAEACLLTGFDYDLVMDATGDRTMRRLKSYLINIVTALKELGPRDIVITGVDRGERILNTLADDHEVKFISVRKTGHNRPGTGDIFSSIVASSLLLGMSLEHAVRKACDFIAVAIEISEQAGVPVAEGVMFEKIMSRLSSTADQAKFIRH